MGSIGSTCGGGKTGSAGWTRSRKRSGTTCRAHGLGPTHNAAKQSNFETYVSDRKRGDGHPGDGKSRREQPGILESGDQTPWNGHLKDDYRKDWQPRDGNISNDK